MPNLSGINEWRNLLGLLPIRLSSLRPNENKFILLNGGSGDFCLQLNEDLESKEFYFSAAWSSNTKNFITYDNQSIFLYNWRKEKEEKINRQTVEDNFPKFYEYINANTYSTEYDVTPFILNFFRKIRNLINEKNNNTESLNLLFHLLASLEIDITHINHDQWGVTSLKEFTSIKN